MRALQEGQSCTCTSHILAGHVEWWVSLRHQNARSIAHTHIATSAVVSRLVSVLVGSSEDGTQPPEEVIFTEKEWAELGVRQLTPSDHVRLDSDVYYPAPDNDEDLQAYTREFQHRGRTRACFRTTSPQPHLL